MEYRNNVLLDYVILTDQYIPYCISGKNCFSLANKCLPEESLSTTSTSYGSLLEPWPKNVEELKKKMNYNTSDYITPTVSFPCKNQNCIRTTVFQKPQLHENESLHRNKCCTRVLSLLDIIAWSRVTLDDFHQHSNASEQIIVVGTEPKLHCKVFPCISRTFACYLHTSFQNINIHIKHVIPALKTTIITPICFCHGTKINVLNQGSSIEGSSILRWNFGRTLSGHCWRNVIGSWRFGFRSTGSSSWFCCHLVLCLISERNYTPHLKPVQVFTSEKHNSGW